uniref:Protein arginine methyltransferase NDUFAF7 n=1 Tax=Ascaris lumbricoides TaxID=6252 RepID=A0A9J2P4X3_ASCLU
MPVADYMRTVVSSSSVGYYSQFSRNENCDIFGEKGDFITAPELSQMFGEMIGVWCYYELANTGHKGHWQLVESGPGTGQLMKDIVGVMERFEEDKMSIHLIETSDPLILEQEKTLCSRPSQFIENNAHVRYNTTKGGIPIYWYRSLSEVPEKFSVFIANEFLDALPVHQFKKDETGNWHEIYVAMNDNEDLCFMLSRMETLFTVGLMPESIRNETDRTEWEVSPDAGTYVNEVAERVIQFGGFGLMIDYGHDGTRKDLSLRAYRRHQLVNPLENPGEHDITADVNFGYLKSLIEDRALIFGPTDQREFLAQMGIGVRLRRLVEKCSKREDQMNLIKSYNMLMSEEGMGTRFKVMSVFPKTLKGILDKRGSPAGFGTKQPSKNEEDAASKS